MVRSFALYNRLADVERALAMERKRREETLTELEKAKDNAAIAQAEKEEILRHESQTIEENKTLKSHRARLDKEVELQQKKLELKRKKVAELSAKLENVERTAIANFKKTDDFQEMIMPVFLEGFEHAKAKFSAAFPDLDISKTPPGQESAATEGAGGEEHAAVEANVEGAQQSEGTAGVTDIKPENADGAPAVANIADKDSIPVNID